MKILLLLLFMLGIAAPVSAKSPELYLFYNSQSPHLEEIGISEDEVSKVFDDEFGPASEELPHEVRFEDFYVAKFPDGNYVFILKAPFNCGQLGCTTRSYSRDADGDLAAADSLFPVKCKGYEADKLLCIKGGYKVDKPKMQKPAKRGPIHYPAPKPE